MVERIPPVERGEELKDADARRGMETEDITVFKNGPGSKQTVIAEKRTVCCSEHICSDKFVKAHDSPRVFQYCWCRNQYMRRWALLMPQRRPVGWHSMRLDLSAEEMQAAFSLENGISPAYKNGKVRYGKRAMGQEVFPLNVLF